MQYSHLLYSIRYGYRQRCKCAKKILIETFSLCHEGYLPAMKNRQTTARRSEQQAIVCDLVEWLQILRELDKRPCVVVNMHGLVHIPKFQIEEINETALCEKIVRMVTKISSMNVMFLQHIVDSDTEMKRMSETVVRQSVEIVHLNDMKIASDNKSQRNDKGIRDDMRISVPNKSRETVPKTYIISDNVTN